MKLLAVETSLGPATAALLIDDGEGENLHPAAVTASQEPAEALIPMIGDLLAARGTRFADLTRLAVCVGPGSFTGIRAGLAAIRGLRLALGLPVVGATGFDIMAERVIRERSPQGRFAIASSAGRDGIYFQVFSAEGTAISDLSVNSVAEAARALPEGISAFAGPAAHSLADAAIANGRAGADCPVWAEIVPLASALARMAATREAQPQPPTALYIKPADARPQAAPPLMRTVGKDSPAGA